MALSPIVFTGLETTPYKQTTVRVSFSCPDPTHVWSEQWSAQQLRNAFCDQEPPRFLIRDRDTKFGEVFTRVVSALGMEPLLTAYRSPWQKDIAKDLSGASGGNAWTT